jgi:uncharacterized membrane protein YfhO
VERVTESANDATIVVNSRGRGFLVMSVTPHKYWRVALDGRRLKPVVTNIGYQGIIVPPGRHEITMRYRNDIIRAAAPVSGSVSAILILIAAVARRPRHDHNA